RRSARKTASVSPRGGRQNRLTPHPPLWRTLAHGRCCSGFPMLTFSSPLWRERDFLRLWAAQSVSDFGARITRTGLPIMAVVTLAAAPAQLGVVAAKVTTSAAGLFVSLTAGDYVD